MSQMGNTINQSWRAEELRGGAGALEACSRSIWMDIHWTGRGKIIPAPGLTKDWNRSVRVRIFILARHKMSEWTLESNPRILRARSKHFDFYLTSVEEYWKAFWAGGGSDVNSIFKTLIWCTHPIGLRWWSGLGTNENTGESLLHLKVGTGIKRKTGRWRQPSFFPWA